MLTSLLLVGCIKDIPLPQEGREPKLVLCSYIQPDSTLEITLSRSEVFKERRNFDAPSFPNPEAVRLQLFVNGKAQTVEFKAKSNNKTLYFASPAIVNPQDSVRIVAKAPHLEPIEAVGTMPQRPELGTITYKSKLVQDTVTHFDKSLMEIRKFLVYNCAFPLMDRGQGGRYYLLWGQSLVYASNKLNFFIPSYITDPKVDRFSSGIAFIDDSFGLLFGKSPYETLSNLSFEGGRHDVTFQVAVPLNRTLYSNGKKISEIDTEDVDSVALSLTIAEVPYATYAFFRSLRQMDKAADNPFAEPVRIPTNVLGGRGVLALLSSKKVELKLECKKNEPSARQGSAMMR